jgi:hypothetical protein
MIWRPACTSAVILLGMLVCVLGDAVTGFAPLPPEVLVVSLMAGWCMAVNSSALTASAMLLGEPIDHPAETIIYRWINRFTVSALVLFGLWLAALSLVKT